MTMFGIAVLAFGAGSLATGVLAAVAIFDARGRDTCGPVAVTLGSTGLVLAATGILTATASLVLP